MEMEGGRRRCITEKAVDIPQRVIFFFCFSQQFHINFPHVDVVDVAQRVKQRLKLPERSKKTDDTLCEGLRHHHHHMQKETSENHVLVHTSHTTYTTRTTLSCLVSSLLFSSLPLLISISSAILLKLTFANMSVGKARPCEQDTRMPINITAQKNFITLLFVCFFRLADVVACSLLVGCWLLVFVVWFAVSLGWLVVTAEHGCELSAVSSHSPNTALDNTQKRRRQRESRVNSGVEKKVQ